MLDLEWYPQEWVDEYCPPAKSSPDGFIIKDGDGYVLGYAADEKGIDPEDRALWNQPLTQGAVINFVSCERFADVDATLRRDGGYELHGPMPSGDVAVMVDGDSDTLHESFEALVEALKQPDDDPFHVRRFIFDDAETEKRVSLQLARWSDSLPHLFEIENGKPVFRPVPATKN